MPVFRVFFQPAVACALLLGAYLFAPAAAAGGGEPQREAGAAAQITGLLRDFLASVGEAATHDRFWAADLVYTSSGGEVRSKQDIMKGFDPSADSVAAPAAPDPAYGAEDILVRQYGDSAALTFRLVAHAADGSRTDYRNSGMFVLRDGRWQAVTWQATRGPAEPGK
ncbi:MAG: nuclear transport factor 2 family protein [Lysobacter sp.]|nr:nuclear transport factor 2 family protein [Lysobacter sp.]